MCSEVSSTYCFPHICRCVREVHVGSYGEGWLVRMNAGLNCCLGHRITLCSPVDISKHLVCEPCGNKVLGGFDHRTNQVAKYLAFSSYFNQIYKYTQCIHEVQVCLVNIIYHIAQNSGRGKLWRIWQNELNSPTFYPA